MKYRQPPKLEQKLSTLSTWLLGLNRELESLPLRVSVPASSTSPGVTNSYSFDATYLYICYATDSWARIAYTDVIF